MSHARILFLCEFGICNGGENSLLSVLPSLLGQHWQVVVAAPANSELLQRAACLGAETASWNYRDRRSVAGMDAADEELSRLVVDCKADLVHANSLSVGRILGRIHSAVDVPAICHVRDIIRISDRAISDLDRLDKLIAVSDATAGWYVELGIPASKLVRIYNGVDLQVFSPRLAQPRYAESEFDFPPVAQIILSIGQIGIRKGLDTLLAAVAEVIPKFDDARLVIVGDRHSGKAETIEYERKLHTAAATPPLAGRVRFAGRRDDVPDLMNASVVLVHAARQEPLGRVLIEACASGLPVVATRSGGTHEIVDHDLAQHSLVPVDEPREMASKIISMLENKNLRQTIGERQRLLAEENFDCRESARLIASVYQSVLSERRLGDS